MGLSVLKSTVVEAMYKVALIFFMYKFTYHPYPVLNDAPSTLRGGTLTLE
ncbi:hypothetical protein [Sulfuracidifex tepidarius]|uniref:Uncharacterized protein n=1 Tax=Sulfuracidifex tepidarius TaxID=1294262 RepID=A0A510E196_9CREN|nr:hypothetical protein [Sulfuracidifex tepidarius]BBG25868.1 hypothetical protein IC007_0373 [Sulfuracidifex tepidarius]